jgi:MFS family permease
VNTPQAPEVQSTKKEE